MNMKLRGLMAAAVIGGASLTGAAALPAGDAQAAVKTETAKRTVVRRANAAQLRRIKLQLLALRSKRLILTKKLRDLKSGRVVAMAVQRRDCLVISTRVFRARLRAAVINRQITQSRALLSIRQAGERSVRCQPVLLNEIGRTNRQIVALQRLYDKLSRQRTMPRS